MFDQKKLLKHFAGKYFTLLYLGILVFISSIAIIMVDSWPMQKLPNTTSYIMEIAKSIFQGGEIDFVIFPILAIGLIIFSFTMIKNTKSLIQNGIETSGQITTIETSKGVKGGIMIRIGLKYHTDYGDKSSFFTTENYKYEKFKQGDKIRVIYHKQQPERNLVLLD